MELILKADGVPERKRVRLRRMRMLATGLLLAMAAILAGAVLLKPRYPWLAWVESFAEASVVGAMADWFAVVALFRHPLGLPIPHTAIVPRNKDRIGGELGRFVEQNFLTPENIVAKLQQLDLVGRAAEWLAVPENSRFAARSVRHMTPRLLNAFDDRQVEALLGQTFVHFIAGIDIAKVSGGILSAVTAGNRHQAVFDEILYAVASWLHRNRTVLKEKFGEKSTLTPAFVDAYIVNRFVDGIIDLIGEVAVSPRHELRLSFDEFLQSFIHRLQNESDFQAKAEALKREVLDRLDLGGLVGTVWVEIKHQIVADAESENSVIEAQLADALARLAGAVLEDQPLRERLSTETYRLVEAGLLHVRHQISTLIEDVVKRWDTRDVSEKIELEVGRDLQFIRLNGTIVGGIVGSVLHALLLAIQ
ncbi:MAG TPA: DUF445 domain-containing protein [Aliidongia sp.]|nr:DUF445 domain-containing protein [Aliidongia sp.]